MNKPRQIPWPSITAEAVAIVISILLAFGIDAWWSNRQEKTRVDESLFALRNELQTNLEEIQRERAFRTTVIASIDQLFEMSAGGERVSQTVDDLLEDVTWGGRIDVSTGALVSILESGSLASIDDGALKRSISSLPTLYETTSSHERDASRYLDTELLNYMNENGSLVQIYNAGIGKGRPGGGEMTIDEGFPQQEQVNHLPLLKSKAFLGLLAVMLGKHDGILLYYDRLDAAMQRSIELIDKHLD